MSDEPLLLPPFPPLKAGTHHWEGEIVVPFWIGYVGWQPIMIDSWELNRKEMKKKGVTKAQWIRQFTFSGDGRFHVSVSPPRDQEPGPDALPSTEQAAAFQHFLDHQQEVSQAVLKAINTHYEETCDEWWLEIFDEDEEYEEQIAGLEGLDRFRKLISPGSIHVLRTSRNGVAHLGFEFECGWDEEHGCGVLTHDGEVVAVGAADAAFDFFDGDE